MPKSSGSILKPVTTVRFRSEQHEVGGTVERIKTAELIHLGEQWTTVKYPTADYPNGLETPILTSSILGLNELKIQTMKR